jgi:hypothetical protein
MITMQLLLMTLVVLVIAGGAWSLIQSKIGLCMPSWILIKMGDVKG